MEKFHQRPIRVLAADDSSAMRRVLTMVFDLLSRDASQTVPPMELCGVVNDGVECLDAIVRLEPDVVLLDLEMPRMSGLDVLRRLSEKGSTIPVIMCSAYTEEGARATLEALACGARDYVMKPVAGVDFNVTLRHFADQLLPRIAAHARGRVRASRIPVPVPSLAKDPLYSSVQVVTIGVSTGGPSALEQMLPMLKSDFPVPILIAQHMPRLFTHALAERLDHCCALTVREGCDGALLEPGSVWIAPGDVHMEVAVTGAFDPRRPTTPVVRLRRDAAVNNARPSVDILFESAARIYGSRTLAVIMTGMGADGLEGCRAVHAKHGQIVAQDEASSAIWGMPGQVAKAGLASAIVPLNAMASELTRRATSVRSLTPTRRSTLALQEATHGLL